MVKEKSIMLILSYRQRVSIPKNLTEKLKHIGGTEIKQLPTGNNLKTVCDSDEA